MLLPNRSLQIRTRSSRVKAEMPLASGSGPAGTIGHQLALLPGSASAGAHPPAGRQSVQTICVVADYPIAQCLPIHPSRASCILVTFIYATRLASEARWRAGVRLSLGHLRPSVSLVPRPPFHQTRTVAGAASEPA